MSHHEGEWEASAPVIELFGVEALVARRIALAQRLGRASVQLNEANLEYNSCIREILEVNASLREQGVDTNTLGRELQQPAPPSAASEGYGHY